MELYFLVKDSGIWPPSLFYWVYMTFFQRRQGYWNVAWKATVLYWVSMTLVSQKTKRGAGICHLHCTLDIYE